MQDSKFSFLFLFHFSISQQPNDTFRCSFFLSLPFFHLICENENYLRKPDGPPFIFQLQNQNPIPPSPSSSSSSWWGFCSVPFLFPIFFSQLSFFFPSLTLLWRLRSISIFTPFYFSTSLSLVINPPNDFRWILKWKKSSFDLCQRLFFLS